MTKKTLYIVYLVSCFVGGMAAGQICGWTPWLILGVVIVWVVCSILYNIGLDIIAEGPS